MSASHGSSASSRSRASWSEPSAKIRSVPLEANLIRFMFEEKLLQTVQEHGVVAVVSTEAKVFFRFLAMPRSGYQSLESRPWSSIVLTIGASVALGVCAGVAYSTYESSLYAPVATTTTSVVTVAPVARAAAGDSFVEASIPAASEEVVETQSFAAPSTSWAAGLSASVSLLVGAAVYKLKSQKPVPSISPLDVYTKGVIPAATLVAAQPAFAMETNKLAPIATALFIALPTFFLIILYVSTRANLDNQSGAFDQDYFDKSKSAGNKKTNLAAKLKGEGLAFYAEKRGGK